MHQETLAYIWHQVPHARKRAPAGYSAAAVTSSPQDLSRREHVPAGVATLGHRRPRAPVCVGQRASGAPGVGRGVFDRRVQRHERQFLEFVRAGGYADARLWAPDDWAWVQEAGVEHPPFWERDSDGWFYRGMFDRLPLPETWPVYVTWAEASAFAQWRGLRLPSEAEFHRAAFATPDGGERQYPWGDSLPGRVPGNFDFGRWDPEPVGVRPEGVSAFGVHDLIGNGWEWTSTVFAPFDGSRRCRRIRVLRRLLRRRPLRDERGLAGHCAVAHAQRIPELVPSAYPYVYATFRCVGAA